ASIVEPASRSLWQAVRDVTPFAAGRDQHPLWRISTAPDRGAALAAVIADKTDAQVLFDWAGGLLWVALAPGDDAGAAPIGGAVPRMGGPPPLIRPPAPVRPAIDVFEPQSAGLAALTKRVKESFDPNRVLNPGRMWAGV